MMQPVTRQKPKKGKGNKAETKPALQKTLYLEEVRRQKSRRSILITEVEDDGSQVFRRGWEKLPPIHAPPMPLLPLERPWKNAAAACTNVYKEDATNRFAQANYTICANQTGQKVEETEKMSSQET